MDIISNEKRIEDLANNVVVRYHEIYSYDVNINNYKLIIENSISEYPKHLERFKAADVDYSVQKVDVEDLELLAELQQRDRCEAILRTEIFERAKSVKILEALEASLLELVGSQELFEEAIANANARYNNQL